MTLTLNFRTVTFQSTPSRRGRRRQLCGRFGLPSVSIHSLTQRETSASWTDNRPCHVSIHSLTQRETAESLQDAEIKAVSIHSLTQRETYTAKDGRKVYTSFNPLPHAEGDDCEVLGRLCGKCFNPLPHAEGDMPKPERISGEMKFQSTPSRRGRLAGPADAYEYWVFQSTPSRRGRRQRRGGGSVSLFVSIHSLTQRETGQVILCFSARSSFNPLPHAEGDIQTMRGWTLSRRFNPLPHAEGDHYGEYSPVWRY